ncbi:hypothetical protein A3715_28340 [Oleiphilus sp. HI0009]|nr:hypothetical protein A3715_10515 [Oleiphilus sp. HI0009]KZX85345.1 hypothetical protein A3715_28340 [Oleiphilus sp. HI0009]
MSLPLEDRTSITQRKIKKAEKELEDSLDWIRDCSIYFSGEKWDAMVIKGKGSLEEFSKDSLEQRSD